MAKLNGVGSGMSVAIFDYRGRLWRGDRLGLKPGDPRGSGVRRNFVFGQGFDPPNEIPEEINEKVARRAKSSASRRSSTPRRRVRSRRRYPDTSIFGRQRDRSRDVGTQPVGSLFEATGAAKFLTSRFASVVVHRRRRWRGISRARRPENFLASVPVEFKARMARATCSSEPLQPGWHAATTSPRRSA